MTEQTALATQSGTQRIESPTIQKAREFASRLKFMIVNGNKLEDKEVYALAHYSAANGLNPFAQEAYYLPGTGPITGIVGFRRKAQESLEDECKTHGVTEPQRFWTETREATPEEANFEDGDIAVHVTLRESLTNKAWRQSYFETARELKALGEEKYFEVAKEFVGKEPVWTGVGVVYASEVFAGVGKKEKFDRFERAAKRAEKIALKKRFPSLQRFESAGDEHDDAISVSFVDVDEAPEKTDVNKALTDMGFDPEPEPTIDHDLQVACEQKDSKGRLYVSLPSGELRFHLKGIREKGQQATEDDGIKSQSIQMIISARESGVLQEPGQGKLV
ncbi:MAG: hypothetical protein WC107_05850 [Patescibacteria group bacterium]|jgi:hypothetical protein